MTSNKNIYEKLTGPEKARFIKEMGKAEYNKLVSHLKKILGIKSSKNVGTK